MGHFVVSATEEAVEIDCSHSCGRTRIQLSERLDPEDDMAKFRWTFIACLLASTSIAAAGPRLVSSTSAPPLAAWTAFCDRSPDECRIDDSQPETIPFTSELRDLLASVTAHVNHAIVPVTDEAHWGVTDVWGYPDDGMGDCEDYQLLKRRLLIEAGLPRRALLMAVVLDEMNQGHAVLTVRTDNGDFILDNKTDEVREWFETGYLFIKREAPVTRKWVFLTREPEAEPTAVASR
jgi:predicted transglutaminase-like cysteine proteinase